MTSGKPLRVLTFDVEEWFHILDHESTKTAKEWSSFESRIHENMDRIFRLLEEAKMPATFFCLGWVAKTYPGIIRSISERGYEIGSQSHMHQLVYEQDPDVFRKDMECSIKSLSDITGMKIRYYRAPGFSIGEGNNWAFEILISEGIEVDCSVFPARHAHGGYPSIQTSTPSLIRCNGMTLKELPINSVSFMGRPVVFSGGGYFRLYPYSLIRRWTRQSEYVMAYFHPRDFDPDQPVIKDLPLHRKFKSYVGLKGAEKKFVKWLAEFEFTDVRHAVETIDWSKAPVVSI